MHALAPAALLEVLVLYVLVPLASVLAGLLVHDLALAPLSPGTRLGEALTASGLVAACAAAIVASARRG